jgi:hypothetical protein
MPTAIANIRPTRAGRPRYRYSDQCSALIAEIATSIDVPPSAIRMALAASGVAQLASTDLSRSAPPRRRLARCGF